MWFYRIAFYDTCALFVTFFSFKDDTGGDVHPPTERESQESSGGERKPTDTAVF